MAFTDNPALSPEALLTLSGNILAAPTFAQGVGTGLQNLGTYVGAQKEKAIAKQQENQTRAWLQQQYPDMDFSSFSGPTLNAAASQALGKRLNPAQPDFKVLPDGTYGTWDGKQFNKLGTAEKEQKRNLISTRNGIYDADTNQWVTPPEGMQTNESSEYGLTPQYGIDKDGNPVILQLSKDGKSIQTPLPEGVTLSKQPIKLDAGTHYILLDPISRQNLGTIPKDISGVERQKVLGENEGKQIAAAPADLQAGLNAKALIESLKTDPNREWGTGWSGWLTNSIPASPGKDYQTKVDQAKSGAFLTAIQQLRGMGSLSNAEGDTATKAVTRMNTATSEEAFLEALNDYEKIIDQGIAKAQSRLPNTIQQQPAEGMNTTSTGVPWRKK